MNLTRTMFTTRSWNAPWAGRRRQPRRPSVRRPHLESLEARCLLSLDSLVVRAAPSGPDKATSVAAWTDVPGLGNRITTAAGSDRTLTLHASPEVANQSPPPIYSSYREIWAVQWDVDDAIVDLINQERQRAGLLPLTSSVELIWAAQRHTEYLAKYDLMEKYNQSPWREKFHNGHVFPEDPLQTPVDRVRDAASRAGTGYFFSNVGEIWYGQVAPVPTPPWNLDRSYALNAVNWWMNSPAHRATILNPDFNEMGVAVESLANGHIYHSVVFGRSL